MLALVVVGGVAVLFPDLRRFDLEVEVTAPRCATWVKVDFYRGETLARSHGAAPRQGWSSHRMRLSGGDYQARLLVDCPSETGLLEQTVRVEDDATVAFGASDRCRCP